MRKNVFWIVSLGALLVLNNALHWPIWLKIALIVCAIGTLLDVSARLWKLVRRHG